VALPASAEVLGKLMMHPGKTTSTWSKSPDWGSFLETGGKIMKRTTACLTGSLLALAAMPALAGTPIQIWQCDLKDEVTEEQFHQFAGEWAAEVRKLPGSEKMKLSIYHPVAAHPAGDTDVLIAMSLPSFEDWGKFWDAYPNSDAAELEGRAVECPSSSVWEQKVIE
jgi:hypothetical protein